MTNINLTYLLKLIDASQALNDDKKDVLKSRLDTLSMAQLAQIQRALEDEQKFNADYYRQVGEIKIRAAEEKIKRIYQYAENKLAQEEQEDIAILEDELAHIED